MFVWSLLCGRVCVFRLWFAMGLHMLPVGLGVAWGSAVCGFTLWVACAVSGFYCGYLFTNMIGCVLSLFVVRALMLILRFVLFIAYY